MARPYAVIGFTMFFVTTLLFEFEIEVTVTAIVVFAAALIASLVIKSVRRDRFLTVVFASGVVACALLLCETFFVYNPAMKYDGAINCPIKAEILDFPEINYGNYYYNARVFDINGEEADIDIRLTFSSPPEVEPYDVIEGEFNIYALGSTDEKFMHSYKSRGIFLGAYSSDGDYTVAGVADSEKPFMKKIIDLREGIKKAVYRIMPDENGALMVAMLIGDKSALPNSIYSAFRTLGISHVICVSGYHLSLWSLLVLEILKKLRVNFVVSNLLASVCAVLFILIAGFTHSAVRAGIMILVYLLGNILIRQRDSLNSLGIALTVLALFRPFSVGSVSLRLSALASAGIILYGLYIEPEINGLFDKLKSKTVLKISKKLIVPLMVTVSATAFTLPVALGINNSFNFLCFAANLIVVPVAGWCMISGALGALFGIFLPCNINLPAFVAKLFCSFITGFSSWLSEFDFFTFKVGKNITAVILCGIFLLCLVTVFVSVLHKKVYSVAAVVCVAMFTVCIVTLSVNESNETKITVVDCGNGTSVFVNCGKENLLIGAGGTEFIGSNTINNLILDYGGELNAVVVPDSEDESCAYLQDVIFDYRPSVVYCDELSDGVDLLLSGSEKHNFTDTYNSENIFVKSFSYNNYCCTYLKTDDISVVVCFDPSFDYSVLPDVIRDADVVISRSNFPFNTFDCTDSVYVLNAEEARADNAKKRFGEGRLFVTGGEGNVVLRAYNGKLKVERE